VSRRRTWRGVALTAVIVLVALAGTTAWQIADPLAGSRQQALQQQLAHDWARSSSPVHQPLPVPAVVRKPAPACSDAWSPAPQLAQPIALITVRRWKGWKFAVVQGTDLPQLALGPGHVPGTAFPGQAGNTGIAGHDITAGNSFLHLRDLTTGDIIRIETRNCTVTYRVYRPSYTVRYTDIGVLRPVHGKRSVLTLITCTPVDVLYFVPNRTIVQAEEVSSTVR
jgi:sortase A